MSTPSIALRATDRTKYALAGLALVSAVLASLWPALAAGLIVLALLVAIASRSIAAAVAALLLLSPWASLGNVMLGARLVALGPDLFFIGLCAAMFALLRRSRDLTGGVRLARYAAFACILIGIAQIANPRGLSVLGAMEGYRAFYLPMLALPLGLKLGSYEPSSSDRIQRIVLMSIVIVALMGLRQVIALSPLELAIIGKSQSGLIPFQVSGTNRLRAFSPLPGPFHFGLLMMIGITIIGAALFQRFRIQLIAPLLLFLAAFLLNATRLNWLGAAGALATAALLSVKRVTLARWLPRLLALGGASLALLLALLQIPALAPLRRFTFEALADPTANASFVYRVLGWVNEIIPAIVAHPMAGYGTGTAKDGIGLFTSHNIIFKIVLEGGFALLVPYLALMAAVFVELWKRRQHAGARAAAALIVGVHAAGMFGPILDAYPGNLYFWLLLGSALSLPTDARSAEPLTAAIPRPTSAVATTTP